MAGWRANLFGRFELRAHDGHLVALPTRKVAGLIAILSRNRCYGVSRQVLGQALWPELSSEKQRNCVKQAVATLRSVLGKESVESSGGGYRFADGFLLLTDLDEPSSPREGGFMPGFEGEWFDAVRFEVDDRYEPKVAAEARQSMIDNFVGLLEYYGEHDPSRMVGMMRESPALLFGIPMHVKQRLLGMAEKSRDHQTWVAFQQAELIVASGSVRLATKRFKSLIEPALQEKDLLSVIGAAIQFRVGACLQNQFEEAMAVADFAIAEASKSRSKGPQASALQNKGCLFGTVGELDRCLELLSVAEQSYRDRIDSVSMQMFRALFNALYGRPDEAQKLLVAPYKVARECGHGFMKASTAFTAAVIRFQTDRSDALPLVQEALKEAEIFGNAHILIPALELASQALRSEGEMRVAQDHFARSNRLRNSMGMPLTPMDKIFRSRVLALS
ncbi:MAG TPA: hypothetical protein VG944_06955 [Fimbriimonas sp.]|nr:hypothetical protein [Fimbriimonas sp.]